MERILNAIAKSTLYNYEFHLLIPTAIFFVCTRLETDVYITNQAGKSHL